MPLPSASVFFLPHGEDIEPRMIDRVELGGKKSFQYFDRDKHNLVDASGFKIQPTGLELIVEVEQFSGHVLISRALLAEPDEDEKLKPTPERLADFPPSDSQLEIEILTAASELGSYIVLVSST
jgi:hypothetical protein